MATSVHVQIKKIALLAILTAMAVVLRVAHIIPIPNMQPVTDILMIATLEMGFTFGLSMAVLVMVISNIFLGFGIWTLPQIVAYAVCVLIVFLFSKIPAFRKHFWLQIIVATLLGYVYGLIVNFGMSIWGGWSAFIVYTMGSFTFDTYHCIGNFIFYPILYKPLTLALERYNRGKNNDN